MLYHASLDGSGSLEDESLVLFLEHSVLVDEGVGKAEGIGLLDYGLEGTGHVALF